MLALGRSRLQLSTSIGRMNVYRWASSAAGGSSCNHVAIVGTGPSGFYTAKYLVKEDPSVRVDLYDALPTPFGEAMKWLSSLLRIILKG